jgi:deoxycytidylate deaminase
MTCAKVTVTCVITATDGERFVGTNACANPQPKCPRSPGESYEKCVSICQQQGHAEVQALRAAGSKAQGATAELYGHTYACQSCQESLFVAGVLWLGVRRNDP